jgi:hypothetical protein
MSNDEPAQIDSLSSQGFFLLPGEALEELTAGYRLLIFLRGQSFG